MHAHALEEFGRYVIYFLILLISWFLFSPLIVPWIRKGKTYRRYQGQRAEPTTIRRNKLMVHLERTIRVVGDTRSVTAVYTFFVISGILLLFAVLFCIRSSQSIPTSIVICGIAASLPYLFLQMRLRSVHVQSSYEADTLVTELIGQYKLNYLNMREAIDQTIMRLPKGMYTRKALFRLSLDIKESGNNEELQEIVNEFAFSIGTQWAIMLSNNIYNALAYRDDVREGLEDVLNELMDLKEINEINKQNHMESFLVIKYVAPVAYVFSLFALIQWFGFTPNKLIDYQLRNPQGLQYFVYTVGLIVLNYVIYFFIRRPKNDF